MPDAKMFRWQNITLATLFIGYVGYYICRSSLSVATPFILDEFSDQGITQKDIGNVASLGLTFYAIGKLTNGVLADYLGGKLMFILGMVVSVACTVVFGLTTGFATFGIIWAVNRYFQSMGWVSMVKVSSRWFPVYRHATVMAVLSMSYLIGDAIAKAYLGGFLLLGAYFAAEDASSLVHWRHLFFIAAGTLALIALFSFLALKSSPTQIGAEEPATSPRNVFGKQGESSRPGSFFSLMMPLIKSFTFWIICIISFGLTLIRETFNFWTPLFLHDEIGLSGGEAAVGSVVFPLSGAVSVLLFGYLSDRIGQRHSRIVLPLLVLMVCVLFVMQSMPLQGRPWLALTLVAAVSFFLMAPYSFLAGVIALDLGGKRGSSTTSGIIDSAGYLGGIVSGTWIAELVEKYDWSTAFGFLAFVGVATVVAALIYLLHHERIMNQHSSADIGEDDHGG